MAKTQNIGLGKIVLTAALTALLTVLSQSYLQNRSQRKELASWKKKNNIEAIDKINETRIEMLEEINEQILQLEIQAKEIKIMASATLNYSTSDDIKHINNLMVKYQKDLYRNAAKAHIVSFFYGDKIDSLIPQLGNALNSNFIHNLRIPSPITSRPELNNDFETIDSLTAIRIQLTEAMSKEIMESYKLRE